MRKPTNFNEYLELSRYSLEVMPDWFTPMLDDQARNIFYRQMLNGKVKDKVVVDLGSGTGMWTIESLSQGAKFVYVVERNPLLVQYLSHIFKDRPVKIISGQIDELSKDDFDMGAPEVIVHELFGIAGLGEGVIPVFQKIWKLFDPNSVELIPQHTWLEGRVLHTDPLPMSQQETTILGENVELLYDLIYPFELKNKVRAGQYFQVCDPSPMIYLDLKKITDDQYYELDSMPVEFKPGKVHTIHISFKFSRDLNGPFFDTYLEPKHHWGDAEIEFYVNKNLPATTRKFSIFLQENSNLVNPTFND
jgi:hypothetical protein